VRSVRSEASGMIDSFEKASERIFIRC
jgi:hypothetical protein